MVADAVVLHVDVAPHSDFEVDALTRLDEEGGHVGNIAGVTVRDCRLALFHVVIRAILCSQIGCRKNWRVFGISDHGKPMREWM